MHYTRRFSVVQNDLSKLTQSEWISVYSGKLKLNLFNDENCYKTTYKIPTFSSGEMFQLSGLGVYFKCRGKKFFAENVFFFTNKLLDRCDMLCKYKGFATLMHSSGEYYFYVHPKECKVIMSQYRPERFHVKSSYMTVKFDKESIVFENNYMKGNYIESISNCELQQFVHILR